MWKIVLYASNHKHGDDIKNLLLLKSVLVGICIRTDNYSIQLLMLFLIVWVQGSISNLQVFLFHILNSFETTFLSYRLFGLDLKVCM
jgi:hypothetical protein